MVLLAGVLLAACGTDPAASAPAWPRSPGAPPRLGGIGDSLSAEAGWLDPRMASWVEVVARTGRLDPGPWLADAPAPRRAGHAANWAAPDATTASIHASGQVAGLAAQLRAGDIDVAVVLVGNDDLLALAGAALGADGLPSDWEESLLTSMSGQLDQALAALRAAAGPSGPGIPSLVVCSALDWSWKTARRCSPSMHISRSRRGSGGSDRPRGQPRPEQPEPELDRPCG